MKKKVIPAKSGKAVSKKGSREVNPFKSDGKVKGRSNSTRTYETAEKNSRVNPFSASHMDIEEDSVSFEYEAAEATESVPEEDVFKEVEAVIKGKRRIDSAPELEAEESVEAEAPIFETSKMAEPLEEAPELLEEAVHGTSEETAKKIWLIESAAAVLASFLALIVASIY